MAVSRHTLVMPPKGGRGGAAGRGRGDGLNTQDRSESEQTAYMFAEKGMPWQQELLPACFFDTKWTEMDQQEQLAATTLGWHRASWDAGDRAPLNHFWCIFGDRAQTVPGERSTGGSELSREPSEQDVKSEGHDLQDGAGDTAQELTRTRAALERVSLVAGVEPLHIACALGYTDIAVSLVRDECRNPFATQQLGACDYSSPAWLFRFGGRGRGDRLSDEDHDARKMWRDFLQLGMSEYIPGCGCSGPYPAITLATGFHRADTVLAVERAYTQQAAEQARAFIRPEQRLLLAALRSLSTDVLIEVNIWLDKSRTLPNKALGQIRERVRARTILLAKICRPPLAEAWIGEAESPADKQRVLWRG